MMETQGSFLWFGSRNTPWTQPQRLGRKVLISAGPSSNQANTGRSSPSSALTGSHYRRFYPNPPSAYLLTCPGTADFDQVNTVIYLVLLFYRMSHQPPHQKLLNTHPSSSQKNKSQKNPERAHLMSGTEQREEQEGPQAPLRFSTASDRHLGYATLKTCTAHVLLVKCSSSRTCYCCSPAQKREPFQLGIWALVRHSCLIPTCSTAKERHQPCTASCFALFGDSELKELRVVSHQRV